MIAMTAPSADNINAVSDLFGAMVQAGAALVAIVGGVVGARYVAVHARRQELANDIAHAASETAYAEEARAEMLRRIDWRAGEAWAQDPRRLSKIIRQGRDASYEAAAADLSIDERYGAEREIDAILHAASVLEYELEDEENTVQDVMREAFRYDVSLIGAMAAFSNELKGRPSTGLNGDAVISAVNSRLAADVARLRESQVLADKADLAEIETIEARGDAASGVWQDRTSELLGLAQSGEYGVALKVLGVTALVSVVLPLGVMIVRPDDSLALRVIGAVVFLSGLGLLARYLWVYANFLRSPDGAVELPSGFWRLMWSGAVPRDVLGAA